VLVVVLCVVLPADDMNLAWVRHLWAGPTTEAFSAEDAKDDEGADGEEGADDVSRRGCPHQALCFQRRRAP
jgi:hypothetical protein